MADSSSEIRCPNCLIGCIKERKCRECGNHFERRNASPERRKHPRSIPPLSRQDLFQLRRKSEVV